MNHRTAAATEARKQRSAERALEDPVNLSRAVRIVRVALERRRITLDEVLPADAKAAA